MVLQRTGVLQVPDDGRIVVGVPGLTERGPAPPRQAERDGLILVSLDARSAADLAYPLARVASLAHDVHLTHAVARGLHDRVGQPFPRPDSIGLCVGD
jgi:hypothetical protein